MPRQIVAERVAHAVDPATLRDLSLWRQASAELMKGIPSAAWTAIAAATKAVLIPDDVLWRVPFEAIAVGDGVLADRTAVVYAGSATSFLRAPSATGTAPSVTMVAVAAPEISGSLRDRLQATAPGWTPRSPESAEEEAREIAGSLEAPAAIILNGSAATESAVRDRMAKAAIVHIAAPFRMNGGSPLFSTILLTPENLDDAPADNNGVLEAREVMNLNLQGALVVFSDGTSASMRGAAAAADVVSWAWRASGIQTIILPRWESDEPTTVLKAIYSRIVMARMSPVFAVQDAAKAIRADEATRAPYYWAGWQVVGR